jgi:Arc-like DNA binding domain
MLFHGLVARKIKELRPVMTRIPEGLRRRLARSADRSGRSMNAEIIHRLEQSFSSQDEASKRRRDAHLVTAGVKAQLERFLKGSAQGAAGEITRWLEDKTVKGPIERFLKGIARETADDIYRLLRERERKSGHEG